MGIYRFLRLKNTAGSRLLAVDASSGYVFFRRSIMLCVIHRIVQFLVMYGGNQEDLIYFLVFFRHVLAVIHLFEVGAFAEVIIV